MWKLIYTKSAQKDAKKISSSGLKDKVLELLEILKNNPYKSNPKYEKLMGDLNGAYSRRINKQHRLVYQIIDDQKMLKSFECGLIMSRFQLLFLY